MPYSLSARMAFTTCALALLTLTIGCRDGDGKISDDFCHGVTDGARCTDGDSCTVDDRCGNGICIGRAVTDGTVCDDGNSCTVDDECRAGACAGLDLCTETDATTGGDGETTTVGCSALPDGATCDDADPCTVDDVCSGSTCGGAPRDCGAQDGECALGACDAESGACVAVTVSDGTSCDDTDACTVGESCLAGSCGGAVFAPDGSPCNDDNGDTVNDRCASGLCAGLSQSCDEGCCDAADGTPCDDGSACTSPDACAGGFCAGTKVVLNCTSLDTACLEGRCDPSTGACVRAALASGLPCDDGDLCSENDACQDGTCTGAAVDCSAVDSACLVGVCEEDTGACGIVARADGMPCDDGDPCTGHDDCTDAICGGEVDLCSACQNKSPGAPCDDGDACSTEAGACVQVAGGLRCEVQLMACSDPGATCAVDVCEAETGACALVSLHDRATCDDGDPCTTGDTCAAGGCAGIARELCGAGAPDFCETAALNDAIGSAIPLAVGSAGLRVLGTLDHGADTDWYSFGASAGQLIDITTSSHCASAVSTAITIVRPSGEVTVSSGGNTPWASVLGARAELDGTYHVAISPIGDADAATYFLNITTTDAPGCTVDEDCGCDRLSCGAGGAGAGTCLPRLSLATEPDDSAATATTLAMGEELLGRLVSPSDQDWFALTLAADAAVDIQTVPACDTSGDDGTAIDNTLRVYAPDGTTELAFSRDDGDGATNAKVTDFVAPADGIYFVRVTGEAGTVGSYAISAAVSGCSGIEPCLCADQVCDDSGSVGLCVPRLTAPEPAATSTEPVPLLLSQRVHSAIGIPYDTDTFTLTVGEGNYDIITTSFCGAALDTTLEVWIDGVDGPELAASDDDSGADRFASVNGFTVASAQTLTIVVAASGAAVGGYIVTVRASTEAQ